MGTLRGRLYPSTFITRKEIICVEDWGRSPSGGVRDGSMGGTRKGPSI